MSVDNLQVIDFISEKDGRIVLTISDHLEWDDKYEHIYILQEKINAYLTAIETGQIEKNIHHQRADTDFIYPKSVFVDMFNDKITKVFSNRTEYYNDPESYYLKKVTLKSIYKGFDLLYHKEEVFSFQNESSMLCEVKAQLDMILFKGDASMKRLILNDFVSS